MGFVLLIARVGLSCVFLVAGLAKLADVAGSSRALAGFGLPSALATPGGVLLPLIEIILAVALLPLSTAAWASAGVLGLLLVFIAAITVSLVRGKSPDCHCF